MRGLFFTFCEKAGKLAKLAIGRD